MLMSAAVNLRGKVYTGADVESANAFGGIKFVAANGEQVKVLLLHTQGNFSCCLRRIGVEDDPALTT